MLAKDGSTRYVETGQYISAAIPTDGGRYIGALTTGIYLLNESELIEKMAAPLDFPVWLRFNDAKCDPVGRLWFGTMPLFRGSGRTGYLYRLDPGWTCTPVVSGISVSNGLAWDERLGVMYYIDTSTKYVDVFGYDCACGHLSNRRHVAYIDNGSPDGMAMDVEGMLWVAVWGTGEIRRINPRDGSLLGIVEVPARFVSSCCFGGPDYQTLYVTSAMDGDTENPLSGRIFAAQTGISGMPATLFAEDSMAQ